MFAASTCTSSSSAWKQMRLLLLLLTLRAGIVSALENVNDNTFTLPEPNEMSCFQYDSPPSCEAPKGSDDFLKTLQHSLQIECALIYREFTYWRVNPMDREHHVNALSQVRKDDPKCEKMSFVYHKCFWCLPETSEFYVEDFCGFSSNRDRCSVPQEIDPALDLQAVCDKFEIRGEIPWPFTLDGCLEYEQAIHSCDWYCIDGHRNPASAGIPTNESCWTLASPPSCDLTEDIVSVEELPEDFNLNAECSDLFYELPDDWFRDHPSSHVYGLSHIQDGTNQCERSRLAYPHCKFCHPLEESKENFCDFPDVDLCKDAGNRKPIVKDESINLREACAYFYDKLNIAQYEVQELSVFDGPRFSLYTREDCYLAEMSLHACNFMCEQPYLGASTDKEKWTLVWLARSSAILSLLGASFILYDVSSIRKNRKTVYHQLLFAMALFDIITAVAWAFSTAPLPVDEAWKFVGSMGNHATCTAQAFFIQLGYTSIFYNASLALYYVLVVIYRWRESDLEKIRVYMHAGPLLVGIALACFLIPFADWTGYGCHILPPPDGPRWQSLVFVVIPLGISVLAISLAMGYMYLEVRKNSRASRKWSLNSRQTLENQVFWQSLFYTLSFYITWPIMFAVYIVSVDYKAESYALTATVSFVAPLQGFTNFIVYARPRILRYFRAQARGFSGLFRKPSTTQVSASTNFSGEYTARPSGGATTSQQSLSVLKSELDKENGGHDVDESPARTLRSTDDEDDSKPVRGDTDPEDNIDDMDPSAKIAVVNGLSTTVGQHEIHNSSADAKRGTAPPSEEAAPPPSSAVPSNTKHMDEAAEFSERSEPISTNLAVPPVHSYRNYGISDSCGEDYKL